MGRGLRIFTIGFISVGIVSGVYLYYRVRNSSSLYATVTNIQNSLRLLLEDDRDKTSSLKRLTVISRFYRETVVVDDRKMVCDLHLIDEASHYMKYSSAICGGLVINKLFFPATTIAPLNVLTIKPEQTVRKALIAHCHVDPEDIIQVDCTASQLDRIHQPGLAVVLDHRMKAIVVILRATMTIQDVVTDLDAEYDNFHGGKAHKGILLSARNTMAKIMPTLRFLTQQYVNYPIRVVGLSLGGGTAALVTLMIKETRPDWPVACFAFGCPAVVSLDIARSPVARECIKTFVLNNDLIPRLGFTSIVRLRRDADELVQRSQNHGISVQLPGISQFIDVLDRTFSRSDHRSEGGSNFEAYLRDMQRPLSHHHEGSTDGVIVDGRFIKMSAPGRIYSIIYKDKLEHSFLIESKPEDFERIIVSKTMLSDHLPWNYETALSYCCGRRESMTRFEWH